MHRSTRLRRLAVAFLVVLVIAVAVRFARAATSEPARHSANRPMSLNGKFFLLDGRA